MESIHIEERPAEGWRDASLNAAAAKYPQPPDGSHIPRNYFVALAVGGRGSGKTFAITQIIKQQEQHGIFFEGKKVGIRTYLISPTVDANPVFQTLKSLEDRTYRQYSDELLTEIIDDVKAIRKEIERYLKKKELYRRFMRTHNMEDFELADLMELERTGFQPPECPYPGYEHGFIVNLVLDDLIGSNAIKQGRSALTNALLRNRHLGMNIFICTQGLKSVPKVIRNNASTYLIFAYANHMMLVNDMYPEVSNLVTEEEFEALFKYATTGDDRPFLLIDFNAPKEERFRKKFDRYLSIA